MKIEQLPSGSYRIRKMYKGKMYTVTFDRKPTQKDALLAMAKKLEEVKGNHKSMPFAEAAAGYVDMKKNVLSPRTVKEYIEIGNRLPDWFKKITLTDIEQIDINRLVNELSKDKSPKTVRNYHGFVSAVLGTYRPEMKIYTKLPQKVKKEPYTPSREDVKRILEAVKGTEFEVPITLACYGMRRSEICALTIADVEGDVVHINKALVLNADKKWVIKTTKTTESTRDIVIPEELAKKIKERGYVYRGAPGYITEYLEKVEKKLGIPKFPLHKLRHYFASEMSALGVPDADILRMGGWETDHVMKTVYRHSMMEKEEQAKRIASDKLREALFT